MDYDFEYSKKWLEKSASTSLILLLVIRDLYKKENKKFWKKIVPRAGFEPAT